VKLVGTKSNRDGIGAVVRVTSAGVKQWQMLRSGSSYLSQSELVLTFGLGAATKADSIEIQWPSGQVDKLSGLASDQTVTMEEGKGVIGNRAYAKPGKTDRPARQSTMSLEPSMTLIMDRRALKAPAALSRDDRRHPQILRPRCARRPRQSSRMVRLDGAAELFAGCRWSR
jgi:hypothetical protein